MLRRQRKNVQADDGQWQNKTNHELLNTLRSGQPEWSCGEHLA